MSRQISRLSVDELLAIADAPDDLGTPALAERLGRSYWTVHHARQRIRAGWACDLAWATCTECGEPVCGPRGVASHPACRNDRAARWSRQYRSGPHRPSTEAVQAWRERNPDRNRELRALDRDRQREQRQDWTPDEWAPVLARLHDADLRDYDVTLPVATARGARWTADDDAYVIEHRHDPAREVALYLGRTLWGVRSRRMMLLRRLEAAGDA